MSELVVWLRTATTDAISARRSVKRRRCCAAVSRACACDDPKARGMIAPSACTTRAGTLASSRMAAPRAAECRSRQRRMSVAGSRPRARGRRRPPEERRRGMAPRRDDDGRRRLGCEPSHGGRGGTVASDDAPASAAVRRACRAEVPAWGGASRARPGRAGRGHPPPPPPPPPPPSAAPRWRRRWTSRRDAPAPSPRRPRGHPPTPPRERARASVRPHARARRPPCRGGQALGVGQYSTSASRNSTTVRSLRGGSGGPPPPSAPPASSPTTASPASAAKGAPSGARTASGAPSGSEAAAIAARLSSARRVAPTLGGSGAPSAARPSSRFAAARTVAVQRAASAAGGPRGQRATAQRPRAA